MLTLWATVAPDVEDADMTEKPPALACHPSHEVNSAGTAGMCYHVRAHMFCVAIEGDEWQGFRRSIWIG